MTQIVARLPEVPARDKAAMLAAPRTRDALADLLPRLAARDVLEVGGDGGAEPLPAAFNVAAWNVERCLFPRESADLLRSHDVQVALLSEVDCGMARTAQRHTTAEMAQALGFHYAYGLEFFELGLGGPTEIPRCNDAHNVQGWHGNAILSAAPFERLALMHLDDGSHWFLTDPGSAGDPEQPRLGGRMAVAAQIATQDGPICVVSTHLESNAQAPYRAAQFTTLMEALEAFAPNMPILIGGDLNTGNHMPPDYDWRSEDLFANARARGYNWDLTSDGVTTRPSLITPHPTRQMKLDWFATRSMDGAALPTVPALMPDGTPLSDHECMLCRITPGSGPAEHSR